MNLENAKKDFPIFDHYQKSHKKDLLYFDNSATTLKPRAVIQAIENYYYQYSANVHRGDYDIGYQTDLAYDGARKIVADFINADPNELFFSSGTTNSIKIFLDMLGDQFSPGDEIITTVAEHSSLISPLIIFAKKYHLNLKYIDLNDQLTFNYQDFEKIVSEKTKLIAIAHITNTVGDVRPIKAIANYCSQNKIMTLIDAAQSIPHLKIDVQDLKIDFLAMSAHKILGPTGIGAGYIASKWCKILKPHNYGGGSIMKIENDHIIAKEFPFCLEVGTPNIAGAIGFGAAIKYINKIGIDNIWSHDQMLKKYLIQEMTKLNNVIIYNAHSISGIVLFNVKGVFSQDVASYLSTLGICVRAGDHCAKLLISKTKTPTYVRISTYLYNTKQEIDILVAGIKNGGDFLGGFFTT